jgi:hypothetical protein
MPNRQMAVQLNEYAYHQALMLFATLRNKGVDAKSYLNQIRDEKKQLRLSVALQVAVKCHMEGTDPLRVRKIVVWRDAEGKPGAIDVEISKVVS